MTPAARLAAAAGILDNLDLTRPVDPQLKAWARANRYAGSKDRRAIADRVYTVLRRRRSVAWIGGAETGRALVLGSLVAVDGLDLEQIAALCSGGYGLAPLDAAERAALAHPPDWPDDGTRLDWPDWLMEAAGAGFGETCNAELDALRQRAPVDLRVNTLKTTVEGAATALREDGMDPLTLPRAKDRGLAEQRTARREPGSSPGGEQPLFRDVDPITPHDTALRLPPFSAVLASRAWHDGLVELQDAGSQAAGALLGAKPGETVLDYCAGGGGKTLALAAQMEDRGRLIAHDVDARRMADIPERARRAGVTCLEIMRTSDLPRIEGLCDRVLVDAPCSGSGSWRRDPAGKWRLTPRMLSELTIMQDDALDAALRYLRPGGSLVYATCSILPVENEARIAALLTRHPSLSVQESLHLHPARNGCDGFFATRLTLTGC